MQLCVFSFIVCVVVSIEYFQLGHAILLCAQPLVVVVSILRNSQNKMSCQEEELCVWDRSGRIEILTYVEYLTRYVM
jgi:hypothetical protein